MYLFSDAHTVEERVKNNHLKYIDISNYLNYDNLGFD